MTSQLEIDAASATTPSAGNGTSTSIPAGDYGGGGGKTTTTTTTTMQPGTGGRGGGGTSGRRRRRASTALFLLAVAIPLAVASLRQVRLLRYAAESWLPASSTVTSPGGDGGVAVADDAVVASPPPGPGGRDTCAAGDSYSLESTRGANVTRRVFSCGWKNGQFLDKSVFPEFDGPHEWTAGQSSTPHDLLIFGAHGPCEGERPGRVTDFEGKILYNNGESFGDPRDGGPCDFLLGPMADSATSIRVPFVSMLLGGGFRNRMAEVFDPALRPRNTGEHYMLYAASNCVPFRDEAADAFSKVGRSPLHLGGKCPHNQGTRSRIGVEAPGGGDHPDWGGNADFYRSYRFALVLENRKLDGYVTEKILNAFLAGSVPVWGGTRQIFDMFNRDAFVYYDESHPAAASELVKRLEENGTMYEEMLARPILADGNATVERYFSFEDGVGGGRLKRRIRRMLGLER